MPASACPRSGCSADHYDLIERSQFLPELDLALIARLAAHPDQQDALDELRRLLG
jgi:hypothetical protein